jgi:hypothetical protein
MTVKVLEQLEKVVTCNKCLSKLQYNYSDTYKQTFYDYTGGANEYRVIKCPVCQNLVKLTLP